MRRGEERARRGAWSWWTRPDMSLDTNTPVRMRRKLNPHKNKCEDTNWKVLDKQNNHDNSFLGPQRKHKKGTGCHIFTSSTCFVLLVSETL